MINDRCREVVNDSVQALHALAKLMPLLTSQSSLAGMLETINRTLGSTLAWISMDDDAGMQRVICAGNLSCHSFDITHFLASTLLQRQHRSWRSIYWKENVGKVLFTPSHPGYQHLQGGVLCKLADREGKGNGYFFLGFSQRLLSMPTLKHVIVVLMEKLSDRFAEIVARERTAAEMQRVVMHYKILFERAPVLMSSFDRQNRCVLWNAECEKVFGWRMAEINTHADPLALFCPDQEERRCVRGSLNALPLNDMYEWHPRRKDGATLTILWSNVPLPDGSILNIGLDITERKKAEQQLAVRAMTDDLTGCLNRSAILQRLTAALESERRQDRAHPFCVLMFDLDYFKQINDGWGHQVGDRALVHFCDCLREISPASSSLGRVGGEEFLLLLPGATSAAALTLCTALREALRTSPLQIGDKALILAFSAGVVDVRFGQRDVSLLLTQADRALYDAKRTGRGKAVVAVDYL